VLCNATRRGDHEHIKDMIDMGYLDIVKWGVQAEQQRSVMIHTLKGLWCVLAMGSRNRRCSCNEYFAKVHEAGIEPLVRAVLDNEEEKRVRQWCKVVVFMMDASRTVVVKDTSEQLTHWRPDAHKLFCTDFRIGVRTLLLCKERKSGAGGVGNMSRDNFETMFGFVGNAWFCRPQLLLEDPPAERPGARGSKRKSKKQMKKRKSSDSSADDSSVNNSDSDASVSDSDTSASDSDASDSDSTSGDTTDADSDKSDSDDSDSDKSDSDSDSNSDSDKDKSDSDSDSDSSSDGGRDVDDM
jgi:hypothetical protein